MINYIVLDHHQVMAKDLFKVVKDKYIWGRAEFPNVQKDNCCSCAGDITYANLGIKDTYLLDQIWKLRK